MVNEIRCRGLIAEHSLHDVGSVAGGRAAVEFTLDTFGRLDVLINNAGFAHGGGTVELPVEGELDALMAVHYKAAIGTISAAIPGMRRRGTGRIINTVSEVALSSHMGGSVGYSAAKAAVWSLTVCAAAELSRSGITVNAISPGARTRLNAKFLGGSASRRELDPARVAELALFLASDEAADVTGQVIHAAGGHLREYAVTRSDATELMARIRAWTSRRS